MTLKRPASLLVNLKPEKKSGHLLIWCLLLLYSFSLNAAEFRFAVVPQQSATKTTKIWRPLIEYLSHEVGHHFILEIYKSIPDFEQALHEGKPDFSYMNPFHYVTYHNKQGYRALVKAKNKLIKGIIVVRKDSDITTIAELGGEKIAFPAPKAFAASLLIQGLLGRQNIAFEPKYVGTHDGGYINVLRGRFVASGGVKRTFNNMKKNVKDKLRILYTTKGYTPHAIAANPRVPGLVMVGVQKALQRMDRRSKGQKILAGLKIKGWQLAENNDWDDVRRFKLDSLGAKLN